MGLIHTITRLGGGLVAQGLGVFLSVTLFAPGKTIFWWTQSAIAMALMLHTPDKYWYERIIHPLSGLASYIVIRRDAFPMKLLLTVCACNASGQLFGYLTMKHFYRDMNKKNISTIRFLTVFTIFPVLLASLVASIPGSLGFYFILEGVTLLNTFINYSFGHISGTATILYPALIVPVMWKKRRDLDIKQFSGLLAITGLCAFKNYFLFGFTSIVLIYGVVIWSSIYMDQFYSSLMGFLSTSIIMGFTISRRGPFNSLNIKNEMDSVVIGTQMAITALTLFSASIVLIFTRIKDLEFTSRMSREKMSKKIDDQMVNLFRIGHDLSNNSTLVKGLCENILDGGGIDQSPDLNVKIMDAINTLNGVLISDMVDVVKCDSDRVVPKERVDIVEFIETYIIVATGMSRLEGKNIVVASSGIGKDTPVVFTNRERLHQIMCNLVGNAVKYTERGRIDLIVSFSDKELSIHVADTGIGISEEDAPRVFDPFYRCNHAKQINSGSGVGLSNVKKICDMIGATIHVSSQGEGKGSTFTLSLERSFSTETRKSFTLRVLAIDDSFVIRKLLAKYLSSLGCDVVSLCSVEEARVELSDITQTPFDVIITDGSMEGQSGQDFIADIREGRVKGVNRETPCIMCSGERHDVMEDRTLFIGKPFSKGDVSVSLDMVLKMDKSVMVEIV